MRATLVCPFDPLPADAGDHLGGVERVYAEVAKALARRGHQVTLLCSTDGPSGTEARHGIGIRRRHRRLTVLRTPVADLARDLPDADVVMVPATYPFTTAPVLRRAKRLGIPTVLDFHFEPVLESFPGRLGARLYRSTGPRAYRLADALVVRSAAYGRSAPSLAHLPHATWTEIPNGVDPARFHPDVEPWHGADGQGGKGYLLFVGRLVPYKGLGTLLQAMAQQPALPPLVVAGDGPLRVQLKAAAAESGLDVTFLGRVPDEELPGLYRSARLTVLPSVNGQEAFGISLLESMACGTPVVASDLPGVAELARHGGLTARTGDAHDLANTLQEALWEDLPRGWDLARRVHADFSWDRIARRFEEVLVQAAARRAPAEVNPVAHPVGHPLP